MQNHLKQIQVVSTKASRNSYKIWHEPWNPVWLQNGIHMKWLMTILGYNSWVVFFHPPSFTANTWDQLVTSFRGAFHGWCSGCRNTPSALRVPFRTRTGRCWYAFLCFFWKDDPGFCNSYIPSIIQNSCDIFAPTFSFANWKDHPFISRCWGVTWMC